MEIAVGNEDWRERVETMQADDKFMDWLEKCLPTYHSEYSGTLLSMYDAFCAGRKAEEEAIDKLTH